MSRSVRKVRYFTPPNMTMYDINKHFHMLTKQLTKPNNDNKSHYHVFFDFKALFISSIWRIK
ncbi:hypothetical protein GCM10010995_10740 [Cysteiniphilum litorale]|uniref:Uncharacterized protein n=1 Tax=Cysteiniphilum litorale TaxID=2056700 RepID=A0A8J3E8R1_9GAMM|nr:hypothetical protein GCM10010995_10740 [Cysteiniphilum litorale]